MSEVSLYADIAFINGDVFTVNNQNDHAQAVAVKGNKILFVGSNEEVKQFTDVNTKMIDLKGRSMTPGLIDSHCHPILTGLMGNDIIDIYYPKVKSIKEIKILITEAAKKLGSGKWIKLWGYDENKLEEKRSVLLKDLDEAAPDNPVQCLQVSGHVIVYNSKAFEIAKLSADDANKFGPNELQVKDGKLTGITVDNCAFYLWEKVEYSYESQLAALKKLSHEMVSYGITSYHDPGEFGPVSYRLMQKCSQDGTFLPRVYMMLHSVYGKEFSKQYVNNFINMGMMTGLGNEHFRFGSCKFMIDGGTNGPSCAMKEEYNHEPGNFGVISMTQEEVNERIEFINNADCQVTAHAVGDKAIDMMLNGYERALALHDRTPEECRHRIEHCGFADEKARKRIKKIGAIPIVNSAFITFSGSNFNKFYGDRVHHFAALRSFLDEGIRACIASDSPTGDANTIKGLDGAVNRTDWNTGEKTGENQKITLEEAIRCYTLNPAYTSFEDDRKGSIETNKLADFAVFSENLTTYPLEKLRYVKIDMTVIDGKIVYERNKDDKDG